jgi:hypothetical protein
VAAVGLEAYGHGDGVTGLLELEPRGRAQVDIERSDVEVGIDRLCVGYRVVARKARDEWYCGVVVVVQCDDTCRGDVEYLSLWIGEADEIRDRQPPELHMREGYA